MTRSPNLALVQETATHSDFSNAILGTTAAKLVSRST